MIKDVTEILNQKFEHSVWSVIPDNKNKLLVSLKNGIIYLIDIYENKKNKIDWHLEQNQQLKYFHENVFVVEQFEDGPIPKPDSYKAVDLNGNEKWELSQFTISGQNNEFLLGFAENMLERVYYTISFKNGEIKEIDKSNVDNLLHSPLIWVLPQKFNTEDDGYTHLMDFIEWKIGEKPESQIEYMETSGHLLISYYIWAGKKLNNEFAVFRKNGSLSYHEIIAENVRGKGFDTFTYLNGVILFIKDNQTIKGLKTISE